MNIKLTLINESIRIIKKEIKELEYLQFTNFYPRITDIRTESQNILKSKISSKEKLEKITKLSDEEQKLLELIKKQQNWEKCIDRMSALDTELRELTEEKNEYRRRKFYEGSDI